MERSKLIESLERVLDQTGRWHRRIDEPSEIIFVLDDGTGDVELRFHLSQSGLEAELHVGRATIDEFPLTPVHSETESAWHPLLANWLSAALRQFEENDRRPRRGRNHARFMVSLKPDQLQALRDVAARKGVPVAESIREAVSQYLARHSESP